MSEFKTGDRVYRGAVGRVVIDQIVGAGSALRGTVGVLWDGADQVSYVRRSEIRRVEDFVRQAVRAVHEPAPPNPAAAELRAIAEDISWDAEKAEIGYVFKMEVARMCNWRDRIRAVAVRLDVATRDG